MLRPLLQLRRPAPLLPLVLRDDDHSVGWVRDRKIGFRGFATCSHAATAAWMADAIASRPLGARLPPLEPLAFDRLEDGRERIVAGDREIGTLLRPTSRARNGGDSFGFEVELPESADQDDVRSAANRIYLALRGTVMQRRHPPPRTSTIGGRTMHSSYAEGHLGTGKPILEDPAMPQIVENSSAAFVGTFMLASLVITAALALLLFAPLTITFPLLVVLVAYLLAGLAISVYERHRLFGNLQRPTRAEPEGSSDRIAAEV